MIGTPTPCDHDTACRECSEEWQIAAAAAVVIVYNKFSWHSTRIAEGAVQALEGLTQGPWAPHPAELEAGVWRVLGQGSAQGLLAAVLPGREGLLVSRGERVRPRRPAPAPGVDPDGGDRLFVPAKHR